MMKSSLSPSAFATFDPRQDDILSALAIAGVESILKQVTEQGLSGRSALTRIYLLLEEHQDLRKRAAAKVTLLH